MFVHAQGSWREIGRSYGEALRDEIQRALEAYEQIAPSLGGDVPELLSRVAPFAEPARRHALTRFEELVGMAEGADIRLEQALLLNCVEELTDFEACTTAASGRFLVHAEMWYPEQTDVAVLVATPAAGPALVAVSCAGFLTGVPPSSAGFAQGVQSIFSTDSRVGVPRVMVSRDALCATDPDRAIREACNPHRAGGYGYVSRRSTATASSRRRAPDARSSSRRYSRCHTNHYLSPACAAAGRHFPPGRRRASSPRRRSYAMPRSRRSRTVSTFCRRPASRRPDRTARPSSRWPATSRRSGSASPTATRATAAGRMVHVPRFRASV